MMHRDPLENPQPLIRRLYSYVAYRIGDGAEAADVTSRAFERALRYRHTFDPHRDDSMPWLIGIARRLVADSQEHGQLGITEVPQPLALAQFATGSAGRVDLQRTVASLAASDRELVALRYGADLTTEQIADLLRLRTKEVEFALQAALDRIRSALEHHGVEPGATE